MSLYDDFVTFSRLQVSSGDIDPAGPVLRYLWEKKGLTDEDQMRLTLIYVAYYDMASAYHHFFNSSLPAQVLPKGLDRRCLRPLGFLEQHLASYQEVIKPHGGIMNWLMECFIGDPIQDWHILRGRFRMVKFNGRWASYKLAKMFKKLHGFPVEIPDLGHKGSSGPRQGLGLLYADLGCKEEIPEGNDEWDIDELDRVSTVLQHKLQADSLTLDMGALETLLCNFAGLYKGRFYVGRNIDRMQSQVLDSPVRVHVENIITEARVNTLNREYLGELRGWSGIRSSLEKRYRDHGLVIDSKVVSKE